MFIVIFDLLPLILYNGTVNGGNVVIGGIDAHGNEIWSNSLGDTI